MKNLLSVLLLLLLPVFVKGQQNHVSNGSFEDTINCPNALAQVSKCTNWYNFRNSPDYFNACALFPNVPFAGFGYQPAHSGVAYTGLCAYHTGNNFEYLGTQISPLMPGTVYEVSISINLANTSGRATNNLGIFFYTTGHSPSMVFAPLPMLPQVHYSDYGIISDTGNWVRLTKYFTADSAYDKIVIGGFNDSSNSYSVDSFSGLHYAYYYIDSVVIKPRDSFYISVNDTALCAGDSFIVQCFPAKKMNAGNTFTAQLSSSTGSFNSPTTIGTITSDSTCTINCTVPVNIAQGSGYRIRVITSSPADTNRNTLPLIKIGNPDSTNIYTSSNSPLCEGVALQFTASTFISGTTYNWAGPAGFNSTSASPTIVNTGTMQSGEYIVTVKWYGCEVKDTISVTVKPLPAKPVAVNNSPLCAGDSLHLSSSSSTSGISFSWAGPGSFSSAAQDTSVANSTTAMNGDYIVTANLNGCNRKDTTTALVKPLPAAVTLSNNTPLCAGDTLHLSSSASTTGSTYSWSGPGSFSATTQNSNRANATAGMTGWYKMLVGLNGCTYSDSTYATVHPIPAVPNISYTNPLCVGETLNLGTASVSGASYSWAGPGNFSSSSQNPTRNNMQFGDTGVYKLSTTVNGCTSDTGTATVHINPLPFVVIFVNPADSICQGDRVNFTALPNNHGGTPAYQWYVNGQASGTGTVFSTTALNHQDVVHCDMTENTKCSIPYTDPSNDITVNVLPWLAPSVSITVNPNRPLKENEYATFTATAANAGNSPQYQWKRNGQDIVGATGSVWSANTLSDNDDISVEIVSSYKCPQPTSAVSNGIVVKVLTGVAELNEVSGLMLYPNPNNGKFVLKVEAHTAEVLKIEIINAMGQMVYRDEITVDDGKLYKKIDMQEVPAGLYMLRLSGGDTNCVIRFSVR